MSYVIIFIACVLVEMFLTCAGLDLVLVSASSDVLLLFSRSFIETAVKTVGGRKTILLSHITFEQHTHKVFDIRRYFPRFRYQKFKMG